MKHIKCPKCGKELIRLEPYCDGEYDFWCDDCEIDISIADYKEIKEND